MIYEYYYYHHCRRCVGRFQCPEPVDFYRGIIDLQPESVITALLGCS